MGCRQPGPDTWGRTWLPARVAGNSGESTGERGGGDSSGPGPAAQAARRRPLVREGPSRSAFSRLKRGSFRPFLSREIRAEEGKGEEPWPGRGRARGLAPIGVVSTYPGRFAATAFCVLVGPVAFIPLIALQHSCPASPPSPPSSGSASPVRRGSHKT